MSNQFVPLPLAAAPPPPSLPPRCPCNCSVLPILPAYRPRTPAHQLSSNNRVTSSITTHASLSVGDLGPTTDEPRNFSVSFGKSGRISPAANTRRVRIRSFGTLREGSSVWPTYTAVYMYSCRGSDTGLTETCRIGYSCKFGVKFGVRNSQHWSDYQK